MKNNKKLRLFTSQHFSILNKINEKGIYIPNGKYSRYYKDNTNEAYKLIINKLQAYPVWCLHSYEGTPLTYKYIQNNIKTLKYLIPIEKDRVLIELQKSKADCLLTDYYNWVDVLYYYQDAGNEEQNDMKKLGFHKIEHALKLRKNCTIQVLIKNIRTEDIIKVYY